MQARGQGHHLFLPDGGQHLPGLGQIIRQTRWRPPAPASRQRQSQGVVQIAIAGGVGVQDAPGAVGKPSPVPGQQVVRPHHMGVGPGIDPGKGRLITGPHGPQQGIGLGLGNGAAVPFGDLHPAYRRDELMAVTLPGGPQDSIHFLRRRPRSATGPQGQQHKPEQPDRNSFGYFGYFV